MSTGLMNSARSEVNMENSANCVFFLTDYADSVVFLILTAVFLSNNVDIDWDNSRLAGFLIFPYGVTVPVLFHFNALSTNAVIVFIVIAGTVLLW